MSTDTKSASPYLWMVSGSFSFAIMAELANVLGPRCDWQLIAFARSGVALVVAAVLTLLAQARFVLWGSRTLWMRSISGSMSLVCNFYAFTQLDASDVITLANLVPIWVALLSWPMLRERPSAGVWLAVVTAVTGAALVQQPHILEGRFATFAALGASFFSALAMIGLNQLKTIDPRAVVVHFSGVSLLFVVASFFLFGFGQRDDDLSDPTTTLLLLGVGMTAAVGQLFLTKAFVSGSAAKVSVVGLSQVVFAVVLELLFVSGKTFQPMTLLGMVLIVIPAAWLMGTRRV